MGLRHTVSGLSTLITQNPTHRGVPFRRVSVSRGANQRIPLESTVPRIHAFLKRHMPKTKRHMPKTKRHMPKTKRHMPKTKPPHGEDFFASKYTGVQLAQSHRIHGAKDKACEAYETRHAWHERRGMQGIRDLR